MSIYGNNIFIDNKNNDNIIDEGFAELKEKIVNINDLKNQWKKYADSFVKHKWIYRYINDKQKMQMEKHYDVLKNENTNYSNYKRSFNAICKFMGIPNDKVIIENMTFGKDNKDQDQEIIALKYSKGLIRIKIPEGIHLIHVSPIDNINALIPSFRSKVQGKYMYPTKRVFFTVAKEIKKSQAGLEKQKLFKYTPKEKFQYAYIDPTYADFSSGSVYIETENPIPVENITKKLFGK